MFVLRQSYMALAARGDELQCQTQRASDYYGLGVRLGIYFAWLSGYVANTLLPSTISSANDTNTIFLLTLLIAMTNDSSTQALAQIDGLVLMHLCSGTIFGILTLWGYRTRLYSDQGSRAVTGFGSYGTQIRMVVSLAVSCYGLWFWINGVTGGLVPMGPDDGSNPPNPIACEILYTFFFAKVQAAGPIRYYYIVICSLCAAYFGSMLLASCITAWYTVEKFLGLAVSGRWASDIHTAAVSRPKYVTGFTSGELVLIHKVLRWANLAWLIFSAVTVECTLNFNHVTLVLGGRGNNSSSLSLPGQLLPFLVGLFGFTRVCYSLFQEKWLGKREESAVYSPALQGGHGSDTAITYGGHDWEQKRRGWVLRYLIAWLPWLSLLQRYDERLSMHGISRNGTGFSELSALRSPNDVSNPAISNPMSP